MVYSKSSNLHFVPCHYMAGILPIPHKTQNNQSFCANFLDISELVWMTNKQRFLECFSSDHYWPNQNNWTSVYTCLKLSSSISGFSNTSGGKTTDKHWIPNSQHGADILLLLPCYKAGQLKSWQLYIYKY